MRKRGAEGEGKWSRVMRKRGNKEEEEGDGEEENKNEKIEGHHEVEEEEHNLQEEANPDEDYLAEGFFY